MATTSNQTLYNPRIVLDDPVFKVFKEGETIPLDEEINLACSFVLLLVFCWPPTPSQLASTRSNLP